MVIIAENNRIIIQAKERYYKRQKMAQADRQSTVLWSLYCSANVKMHYLHILSKLSFRL